MNIERDACIFDVAVLVSRLPDEEMLRLWGAMGSMGGADELRRLMREFYRLDKRERGMILKRMERLHRFTLRS